MGREKHMGYRASFVPTLSEAKECEIDSLKAIL